MVSEEMVSLVWVCQLWLDLEIPSVVLILVYSIRLGISNV